MSLSNLISIEAAKRAARVTINSKAPITEAQWKSLESDFETLTKTAFAEITQATGSICSAENLNIKVVDKREWLEANIVNFGEVFNQAIIKKLGDKAPSLPGFSRTFSGIQIGLILGWVSNRVLGQYSFDFSSDLNKRQKKTIYYIGPNICEIEKRYGFSPMEFRLWLALHEVTHYIQFESREVLATYFDELFRQALDVSIPNPREFLDALKKNLLELRKNREQVMTMGLINIFTDESQRRIFEKIQVLMSLVEGEADLLMTEVGKSIIPSAPRFARILKARRQNAKGFNRLIQQLLGLDAKLRQYGEGEYFLRAVANELGLKGLNKVFESTDTIPTLEELKNPSLWLKKRTQALTI